MKRLILIFCSCILLSAWLAPAEDVLPTPGILPQRIYGLSGEPCAVRFESLVFAPQKGSLLFDVESGPGSQFNDHLLWRPKEKPSESAVIIGVYSGRDFRRIATLAGDFVYCDPQAVKAGGSVSWLAIGDSLTAPGHYISQTLETLGKYLPQVAVVTAGTQHPKENPAIRHEGRGGWSWGRYLEAFPPKSTFHSPFVFGPGGEADFNFERYLREQADGKPPEIITIFLGANDVYGIAPDFTPEKVEEILRRAKSMVDGIRKAAPSSVIGIVPPPPCSEQNGFGANYGNGVTEWQYRRAMQYYIAGLLQTFDGRWDERIYIVPGYLGFDPATAFPSASGKSQNALHPKAEGYTSISLSLAAWIVHLLSNQEILSK